MDLTPALRKNILLLFLLFATSGILLHGQSTPQNIKFNNISIKNGLSQSSPNCIFQDSRGIIWIGTEDGLNKYDGYSFTVFRPGQDDEYSISNSRILSLTEDDKGNLWIGTNGGGLNRYDRNENRFYRITSKENGTTTNSGTVIHCILIRDKELWIGTDKGLSIYNSETENFLDIRTSYPEISALINSPVFSIVYDHSTLWAGTLQGLFRFNTSSKTFDKYLYDPDNNLSIPANHVTALLVDISHNLVIGTNEGLAAMDSKTGEITRIKLPDNSGGMHNSIKALLEDESGNLWAGTMGNGLFVGSLNDGMFVHYIYDHLNPYSIKNNEVLSLFKDYSGLIWVGTNGIDVYNPKKEKFVLYDYIPYSREQLIFRNIHPIYEDDHGVIWIGSKTDGLHILDRFNRSYRHWTHNQNSNSISSNRVRAVIEYPEGVIWVGTEDQGLDKIYVDNNRNPVRVKNYSHNPTNTNSLTSNKIYALHIDARGRLWIGTDNGLTIMDIESETFKQYVPDEANPTSISNTTVYGIYRDYLDQIWLATDLGVNKYDTATDGFIHFMHDDNNENSIIHNEILCFHEDGQHNLWIGTYGKGIDKYDPVGKKFIHFTHIPELAVAVIYGILEDNHGNFWMSSNNGILKFNEKSGEIKQFTIEDGLQSNEFNGTSYLKNRNGEMFFGGQYGFNSFYPDEVKVDTSAPKIILADLQVLNNSVTPGKDSPINKHINEANEIILNYKQNNFTLYFSALHFANPERNQYKYKLEGFDNKWIDAGNKRFVSYTNLPYKNYKFRVIASNSDGVWNEKGLTIKIRVKPPFWATLWFRILLGITLIGLVYLIIKRQLTLQKRQEKIIQEKFEVSSAELEQARAQLEEQHAEIVIQKRELLQRQKDQENLLWFNQGLGMFSDLISKNREDLPLLCKEFIEKLVDYVEAQQGGIFLYNEDANDDQSLELIANYAFSVSRHNQKFNVGEGYVGCCFKDKKYLEIDNLSENYSELSSGLGSMKIKHLVLAPLVVNTECIGIIEIGSFKKIKGYRNSFIEKLAETFAATVLTEQANKKLKNLIERSTDQAKTLSANEDQLRKNLEEIMNAHEESSRREDELIKLAEESATREEMLSQEIEELKCKIESLSGQQSTN
jgi:ligand-binding sensor domain-containing protein